MVGQLYGVMPAMVSRRVSGAGAANITLEKASVGADVLLGEEGKSDELLEKVLDRARAGLSDEMPLTRFTLASNLRFIVKLG